MFCSIQQTRGQSGLSDTEDNNVLESRSVEELYNYAEWLFDSDIKKALLIFDKVIAKRPEPQVLKKAYFGRGKCLYVLGRYLDAFNAIEESFPVKPVTSEVAERCNLEFKIGKKIIEKKDTLITGPKGILRKRENGYQAAIRIFRSVIYNDPQGVIVPQAMLELGDAYYEMGKLKAAYKTYVGLTRSFPENSLVEIARIKAAKCLAGRKRTAGAEKTRIRKEDTIEAERLLKKAEKSASIKKDDEIKNEYASAKNLLAVKAAYEQLESALFYLKRPDDRSKKSGIFVLKEILRRYPGTDAAEAAAQKLKNLGELSEGDVN
ncbi:MAG: tetratricopeptide repeat protein [Planctomycetota bacterium]